MAGGRSGHARKREGFGVRDRHRHLRGGRYDNAATGNHAAIFLGPDIDEEGRVRGIQVIDQSSGWHAREHTLPFGEPASGHGYYADQFSVIRR